MKLKPFLPSMLSLLTLALIVGGARAERPNIVFVLADDLAWADVGYNGNKFYETPNIDRLAAAGMIFNRGYSGGPNCLPTRACLISGMYSPRTQIWTPGGLSKGNEDLMRLDVPKRSQKNNPFPSELNLDPSVVSIAEVLKSVGYKTARFGKWHVGPDTQGFDISDPSGRGAEIGKKLYGNINVAEWLTDAGVKFIQDENEGPFFLYVAHWDVHSPIRARSDVKARFDKKLAIGRWSRQWNTTYSAMIHAVDTSVGRLMNALEEQGIAENTLFVFSSDNGGAGATTNKPLKGAKGALTEGGIRVAMAMRWPEVIQAGSQCETPVTSVDFLPTFADISEAKLPTQQPVDGVSVKQLMQGQSIGERSIFWHYPLYLSGNGEGKVVPVFGTNVNYWRGVPASVIMKGDWKLIHYFEDDSVKLFDLKNDLAELKDLSTANSKKAAELRSELATWQAQTKAIIPTDLNPTFDSSSVAP